jgi:plastocyanin
MVVCGMLDARGTRGGSGHYAAGRWARQMGRRNGPRTLIVSNIISIAERSDPSPIIGRSNGSRMHQISTRPHFLLTLAGVGILLAACSNSGTGAAATATAAATPTAGESQAASGGEASVNMVGFKFDPATLTVKVGTKVTFKNSDGATHNVAEGQDGKKADGAKFDEEVKPGASTTITFDTAGTVHVTCLIHPTMNMTVTVES